MARSHAPPADMSHGSTIGASEPNPGMKTDVGYIGLTMQKTGWAGRRHREADTDARIRKGPGLEDMGLPPDGRSRPGLPPIRGPRCRRPKVRPVRYHHGHASEHPWTSRARSP